LLLDFSHFPLFKIGLAFWDFSSPFSGEFSSIFVFFLSALRFCKFILVILDSLSLSFRSFFVGVSRFAETDLGPPPLEGCVSSDSVLHQLAAELYSIVYLVIST
jgi:hypothetical protein